MHASKLVEIAGWICVNNTTVLNTCGELPDDALAEYWIASRCRLDRWGRTLRRLGDSRAAAPDDIAALEDLADEIVLADILSRGVAAITRVHDERHRRTDASAIGKNAMSGHAESVGRLRALTDAWWPRDSEKNRGLRSLSAAAAQWTDMLLSYFDGADVRGFAHNASRLEAFVADRRRSPTQDAKAHSALIALGIRSRFVRPAQSAVSGELNRRIGGAALGLFGAEAFDGFGLPRSPWMIRIERSAEDSVAMLNAIFADAPETAPAAASTRWRM